jgi:hypothetical protein
MTKPNPQRERQVALALLVRRHLIGYENEIKAAYARFLNDPSQGKPATAKAKRNGARTSTALAKLIGLPPYHSPGKAKPEAAKHLFEFMKNAGSEHFDLILQYFKNHVITPDYRAEAPPYIRMAIYEVFDAPSSNKAGKVALEGQLKRLQDEARYAPHAVIAAIEETVPQLTARAKLFEGTWNVIRFAHHGRRVVRIAMEIKCHENSRPTFTLYFRTRGMTLSKSKDKYVTIGSLIVLKGGQHVMFIGHEEVREGQPEPDGYPVTIICPTRIARDGPFFGLVQRRHDDGKVFAIKAQFVRDDSKIDELLADNRVGSFESEREISTMGNDIRGFFGLLDELRRFPDDLTGGLVL